MLLEERSVLRVEESVVLLEERSVLRVERILLLEESFVLLEERVALMQRPQRSQDPFLSQEGVGVRGVGRTVREEVVRVVRGRRRKGDTNLRVRRWRETN